jgi:DNA-binding LacI/PurR family transcriptional regulator
MQNQPKIPKYWKLSQTLREQIESGALSTGARLPSVAAMQAQHSVSLSTVNQACALLEKDGLIVREQGRGTFVAPQNAPRTTRKLGLVLHVDSLASFYTMELLTGMREEAARQKLDILWLSDEDIGDSAKADAILMYCHPTEALAFSIAPQVPHALLFHHSPDFTCVVADDFAGAKLGTQHLLELGHRRIAYLLLPEKNSITSRRLAGYHAALAEAGLADDETLLRFLQEPRRLGYRASAEATIQEWLQTSWRESGCTAILAHNDETAIGVVRALRARGLRVPQDVSVVGFDGTELSELSTPALTTVRVPLREIGAAAAQVLVSQMKQGVLFEPQKIVLPVQLKIGASTAPVPIQSGARVPLHN